MIEGYASATLVVGAAFGREPSVPAFFVGKARSYGCRDALRRGGGAYDTGQYFGGSRRDIDDPETIPEIIGLVGRADPKTLGTEFDRRLTIDRRGEFEAQLNYHAGVEGLIAEQHETTFGKIDQATERPIVIDVTNLQRAAHCLAVPQSFFSHDRQFSV